MSDSVLDCAIVGGGQSALATAFYLRREGRRGNRAINFAVFDDQPQPGGAWQHMWPSMTLFSSTTFSNLPGMPMPGYQGDGYPPPSHVVDYLREYENRYDLPVVRPAHIDRVEYERTAGLYHLHGNLKGEAETWRARTVVAATGTWSTPFVPYYPGTFSGTQWHTATYPGREPFAGSAVAVVGAANSGAQIAADLSEVADVTWYVRHSPRWMPDDIDGAELFRRNRERYHAISAGQDDPGADSNLGDIVMLPAVRHARDTGRLRPTPMFATLDDVSADHLVWCTGFRPALGPFRGLLSFTGDAPSPQHPGLFLVGYGDWVGPGSATITGVGVHAKRVAAEVVEATRG
ncbi:NAD(P)-binding domain-containing protein [uncultured Corynebacterium sp.]|uniref:NAD(P)-binding domain-containing protein n=1 Tax=uncultured Corynebacterium sp. TaxID=159447 RepID=UPI0025F7B892|nr:NAD(P)-binding domain-containing protein [uncultured Corynebacterium sp.]